MASFDAGNHKKYNPASDVERGEEILNFNFIVDPETRKYIQAHGRVMFIIRGPSGTGKSTLSALFIKYYPSAGKCSADNYFDSSFEPKVRNKKTLTMSHEFCQQRISEECENGANPVVVQNTHMRKWETKPYIDIAHKYGYTIVMAITLRKFIATPEILELSNRHGLTKQYFERRLRQWEEYIPDYIGWFLGPEDCSFLLNQGKEAISMLIGDGKFCSTFDTYCEEDILQYFEAKDNLFCMLDYGGLQQMKKFYLSDAVQNEYGKCASLSIHGFVVTKSSLLAMVKLASRSKDLFLESKKIFKRHDDDLSSMFEQMEIHPKSESSDRTTATFDKDFSSKGKTILQTDWTSDEDINVRDLSIITLGQHSNQGECVPNIDKFIETIFSDVANSEGNVSVSEFSELDNGARFF